MTAQPNAAQGKPNPRTVSTILQWTGLAETGIGVVFAFLMPSLIPGDPVSVQLGVIGCALVALGGVGLWAYARFLYVRHAGEGKGGDARPAGTVERRDR